MQFGKVSLDIKSSGRGASKSSEIQIMWINIVIFVWVCAQEGDCVMYYLFFIDLNVHWEFICECFSLETLFFLYRVKGLERKR